MPPTTDIDVTFDFRRDTPPGRDPDAYSPTLRRHHRLLWSKPLPSGALFTLVDTTPRVYLHHRSALGEFFLSSDAVVPSFRKERRLERVIARVPADEWESFLSLGYTMGGMMLFASNQVDRRMTINGARGCHPLIKDRFDLTVECIRRHYVGEDSPLASVLARYRAFFDLFESFAGYVNFFLLQDIVDRDRSSVRFFHPFDDFRTSPVPGDADTYGSYRRHAERFLHARNARMLAFLASRIS